MEELITKKRRRYEITEAEALKYGVPTEYAMRCRENKRSEKEKEYRRETVKLYRRLLPELVRERERRLQHNWRLLNPDKAKAAYLLRRAVKAGLIKRMPCEKCGKENSCGHHEDYSKPLSVNWLCPECHMAIHKEKRIIMAKTS